MPSTAATSVKSNYVTSIADTEEQIRAAQRLRYRVLADELGIRLDTPLSGHDVDGFDEPADHLIVTDTTTDDVVGTYRLLPPGRAEVSYADTEFDLSGLRELRPSTVEAGRACVHPDHRRGAVVGLLWAGLARYALLSGRRYLAGCASVPLADGGRAASSAWLLGAARYAAPAAYRVHPRRPWTPRRPGAGTPDSTLLPPLLRGYLRLGAWVCGPPAHDPEFDVADFFVLLDMERLDDRHRRYFLRETR
ncbi:GNAT family N-acetyltransferase [Streptomyces acidiscabies]|uniref:GNAT family N-acetyltransferase n=3 Tax=Streptomyces acidiscabies TaxID=42234 RepID=A0AAP6BCE2_9ACTN|nr:GNAT family N-acyltransferase [Streptomyces acidiscabies]MBP5935927.1 GNAT family N-acetyltransferase [Streptomyces sp. LBUM 1476]MBZ3916149.1 GNAT family N-acetyltransferase [Streptomyces acidiscabies]MDX2962176.1 GNAT family N-acetyltransferase [Streptomyces acidiscabies]MDX3017827.1 GNAT family N-acetyltransferase [Streptomyces acidiscabies]MDX3791400.1 GNAT family N-acetyltransferase [Streptomyces acidiscabies]